LSILDVSLSRVVADILHVIRNGSKLLALLIDDLRDLSEEHVQVADTLLDIADLLLALNDKGLLEVNLVLLRKLRNLLLLL
jgi:hypothetical protein